MGELYDLDQYFFNPDALKLHFNALRLAHSAIPLNFMIATDPSDRTCGNRKEWVYELEVVFSQSPAAPPDSNAG
jgi:hypothetical protein